MKPFILFYIVILLWRKSRYIQSHVFCVFLKPQKNDLRIFCTKTIDRQQLIPDPDFHVKKSTVLQLKSQLVIQLYGNFLTCQKLAPPPFVNSKYATG